MVPRSEDGLPGIPTTTYEAHADVHGVNFEADVREGSTVQEHSVPLPTVIALPGTLCAPATFEPLRSALRGRAEVDIVPWLHAPGPWNVPTLAARVARHIENHWARAVVVCGHSTGGAIAMQLAVDRVDLVKGLVLVDTGSHMRGHGDVDQLLDQIRSFWSRELRTGIIDRCFYRPLDPATRRRFIEWADSVSLAATYGVLSSQRALDLTERLHEITVPVIVVHGRHDRARPVSQGEQFARLFRHGEFRLVEAGHTPTYEKPEEVAEAILDVLARANSSIVEP